MFQQLVNTFYRHPKSKIALWKSFGGYFEYRSMLRSEQEMIEASKTLHVKKPINDGKQLEVSFLTGQKYWHQTIFCAYSLQKHCEHPILFNLYDDGSFTPELITTYKTQIPNSRFVTVEEIEQKLNLLLPKVRYPYLNHKREVYKHIRKLIDIHIGNKGWQLVLDSDMLFWKMPNQLINWLKEPKTPFYISDINNAYGFPIDTMEDLIDSSIPDKVNVGIIGLKSEGINFDKLELWAKDLESKHGTSYYLEQALSALLIGENHCEIGNSQEYIVYPNDQQILKKQGTLHHYVDLSKKKYLTDAWKQMIEK
ncbi:MAG: glycosyl transferase [Pedobacter sp.]|nr:MAG: glycosyl transferase [Pedobacter sp.]